jgi:hypothetical protein
VDEHGADPPVVVLPVWHVELAQHVADMGRISGAAVSMRCRFRGSPFVSLPLIRYGH